MLESEKSAEGTITSRVDTNAFAFARLQLAIWLLFSQTEPLPVLCYRALVDFQWAAVKSGIRILRMRHGVFISDVVGLGKSFIAAALLKWLKVRERQRALIICPTPLVKMWRDRFVDRYDLGAEVLSLGMLSQPNFAFEEERFQNKQIVLLDESHNLRHSDSLRYDRLHQFLHALGLPVVMLTATPRNSRARDILNQIRLFNADTGLIWVWSRAP